CARDARGTGTDFW
nr:immunoglobulin heavy chain junction region [Macaca mulatta]MOW76264.1 immunoglobulin heavy chain junction region [Macaca mulatta]MOW76597.1 immunoglobulin heavy chain junction region [Macaca mulatta]MOW77590.1 immunoglobulin heavy chain junction region [Macaca mulatta]MOW78038.1 immunoglobulin heavy chain junction region [Macaca mulatta]